MTGNRRIDRVLAEDFLDDLTTRPLDEVRALRKEAEQEEVDTSYIRRLLQGRLDIIQAEIDRRAGNGSGSLLDALPGILADETRAPARGMGRHTAVEPSRVDAHRRLSEAMVADVDVSNVGERTDAELAAAQAGYTAQERELSQKRRAIHKVMDACSAEITRRYQSGEADVADLLAKPSTS